MAAGRLNAGVVDWTRVYDSHGAADRVPGLLDRAERGGGEEVWAELWDRLCLHGETVFPASFAALPRLVEFARTRARALELAGAIVRGAAHDHGSDALFADCTAAVTELRELVDHRLRTRPGDWLSSLRDLLATAGQYHWSAVLEDFTDDFYPLPCPHCAGEVTVAIGVHGCYAAIRDWDRGDVERRPLRPASPAELRGVGRWMYDTAVRDGQAGIAWGITYLFGRAQCPRCGAVFTIAEEYTSANLPPCPGR
ncbi:hypothetical protein SUDANB106_00110 [Streptomyces sp. enrichment culture]|uniref:hypothetical protein n=1 Tax=Streptomyces sp. enrichment culture TaxID=1795815 RepID=UPI003F56CBB3